MENKTDGQLIGDYLEGDEKSLEVLVKRYLKPVYAFVFRNVGNAQDAEDMTQETFARVWKNLKKFDKDKSFKNWIFSIARNASIDFLRKKKTIPFSSFENSEGNNFLIDSLADFSSSPEKFFEKKNAIQELKLAIEGAPSLYKEILSLHLCEQLTFQEIADFLGESINTVKSRYRRGAAKLRKSLSF